MESSLFVWHTQYRQIISCNLHWGKWKGLLIGKLWKTLKAQIVMTRMHYIQRVVRNHASWLNVNNLGSVLIAFCSLLQGTHEIESSIRLTYKSERLSLMRPFSAGHARTSKSQFFQSATHTQQFGWQSDLVGVLKGLYSVISNRCSRRRFPHQFSTPLACAAPLLPSDAHMNTRCRVLRYTSYATAHKTSWVIPIINRKPAFFAIDILYMCRG